MFSDFFYRTKLQLYTASGFGLALFCLLMIAMPAVAFASGMPNTSATAKLEHIPTGTANLTLDSSAKTLTVKISLIGLQAKSIHPDHIHEGSCAHIGAIKYPLQTLTADATGQSTATTVLQNITAIPASGWAIVVHNGPDMKTADEDVHIACGNILNPSHATSVTTALGPSTSPNEAAMGTAQLSVTNTVLTVTLDVTGLAPNSSHAAHIHSGSCLNTQQMVYDLGPLTADANGHATKTVTIPGVSAIPQTGWDINVHYSTDLSTQTGYNPILCGDIMPS